MQVNDRTKAFTRQIRELYKTEKTSRIAHITITHGSFGRNFAQLASY